MAVLLISWKMGRAGFTRWHIVAHHETTLCGLTPMHGAIVNTTPGLLSLDGLCKQCLRQFSLSEDDA